MADEPLDRTAETGRLPAAAPPTNHGRTPAAWVTVSVVVLGGLLSSAAVVVALPWLFWVGIGVIVIGVVLGQVLRMLGFGQPVPSGPSRGSAASDSQINTDKEIQ
jgi:hypothetical protein